MKVLITSCFLGLTSFQVMAEEIKVIACDENFCEELTINPADLLSAKNPPKAGKGSKRFLEVAANTTGQAIGIVTATFNGIRDSVVSAGYHTFEGTLRGPAGTIQVSYNFQSGSWSVSGSGSSDANKSTVIK